MNQRATLLTTAKYQTIDDILGNKKGRYFGHGFKNVSYLIHSVSIDSFSQSFKCLADIIYPSNWSQKEGKKLTPHLSSIDAVFLNYKFIKMILANHFSMTEIEKERILFRKVVIKSGPSPQEVLVDVPIIVKSFAIRENSSLFYKNLTEFSLTVGGMLIASTVEHDGHMKVCNDFSFIEKDISSYSLERCADFLSREYDLCDIFLDLEGGYSKAKFIVDYRYDDKKESHPLSPIECIMASAQMAQSLIYQLDNLDRGQSNTLWMRNIQMENLTLFKDYGEILVEVWLKDNKSIEMRGEMWMIYKCLSMIGSTRGIFTIAHKIPKFGEV